MYNPKGIKWKSGDRKLLRVYEVHHKDDTEKKVRLRTPRTLTACQVKERVVSAGMFDREIIKELRVKRAK